MRSFFLPFLLVFNLFAFPKEQLSPGGLAKLFFKEKPEIFIKDQKQKVFTQKREDDWMVLIPLSLYKKPELVKIVSQTSLGKKEHLISMKPSSYPTQHITVKNREYVAPSKKTTERIKKDSIIKKKNFALHTPLRIDSLKMIKPLDSDLRHDFGRRRFFNKVPKSPHAGIDLSGKKGDKIKAPLSGEVILLGELFYNGNMMLIDHGEGLITAYSHLSKIYKPNGYRVKQGEFIAEVGATGRVTGPHLHWSVYLNGEPVNPDLFLDFGKTPALKVSYKTKGDSDSRSNRN